MALHHLQPAQTTAIAVAVLLLTGCQFKGGVNAPNPAPDDSRGPVWQVQPERLRIYPSSRFSEADGQPLFECRLELIDEMNDPVKGIGQVRIEMYRNRSGGDSPSRDRMYSWDVPLLTLAEQRMHYDSVTRAYYFRLRLDEPIPPQAVTTVVVSFLRPDGRRLSATTAMTPHGPQS